MTLRVGAGDVFLPFCSGCTPSGSVFFFFTGDVMPAAICTMLEPSAEASFGIDAKSSLRPAWQSSRPPSSTMARGAHRSL